MGFLRRMVMILRPLTYALAEAIHLVEREFCNIEVSVGRGGKSIDWGSKLNIGASVVRNDL